MAARKTKPVRRYVRKPKPFEPFPDVAPAEAPIGWNTPSPASAKMIAALPAKLREEALALWNEHWVALQENERLARHLYTAQEANRRHEEERLVIHNRAWGLAINQACDIIRTVSQVTPYHEDFGGAVDRLIRVSAVGAFKPLPWPQASAGVAGSGPGLAEEWASLDQYQRTQR